MPWIFDTIDADPLFGIEAKLWWRRPSFIQDGEEFFSIALPDDVAGVDEIPTDFEFDGNRYATGGFTQNMIVTRDLDAWSQGIEPPVETPSVATQGTGITATVICYWSYWDDKSQERSALSRGKTLVLANQGVRWTNHPVPKNPRVTHIELWRSVDGGLPRLVLRRQVGLSGNLDEAVAAGNLGEAFTEDFGKFPRCRVNAFYHNRQYMAGFEGDRARLYCSLIDFPERMSSLDLRTRNGEPIIALAVVNDYLLVLCPFATYVVTGYTEDDIQMQIAKPDIGIISPHAWTMVSGEMEVYTHQGPYRTDGASWHFIGNPIQNRYVQEYRVAIKQTEKHLLPDADDLNNYESAWLVNDVNGYCTKLWVKDHSDTDDNTYWVSGYEHAGPGADGSYNQPVYSYDTCLYDYTTARVLSIPGSRMQELVSASTSEQFYGDGAFLLRENMTFVVSKETLLPTEAPTDHEARGMVLRMGSNFMGDEGGDNAHGKRFTDLEVYLRSDRTPGPDDPSQFGFKVDLWTGDIYASLGHATLTYALSGDSDTIQFTPSFTKTQVTVPVIDSTGYPNADLPRTTTARQPKTSWHYPLARAVGQAAALELQCWDRDALFMGWGIGYRSGPQYGQTITRTFED